MTKRSELETIWRGILYLNDETRRKEGGEERGRKFFLKKGEVGKEKGNSRAVMFSMAVLCNY